MSTEFCNNIENKEKLIEILSSPDFDNRNYYELYREEIYWTANGNNSLDFLEILPWDRLGKVSCLIYSLTLDINGDQRESEKEPPAEFARYSKSRVADFLTKIRIFLNTTGIASEARLYLQNSRKIFGMASSREEILQVSEALFSAFTAGLFPNNELVLFQFPGAFLPFPHKAHLELTEKSFKALAQTGTAEKRVIASTFLKNSYRQEKNPPFPYRIDLLKRGFGLQDFVTVLGIGGDSDEQYRQMELVSRLSVDGIINYLCGSDTIIKKVNLASDGDERAQKFFEGSTHFWVSLRPGEDIERLNLAIKMAQNFTGSKITILPSIRTIDISGTQIRQGIKSGANISDELTNSFIAEAFTSQT